MSAAAPSLSIPRRMRAFAWVPAALLATVGMLAAAGVPIAPDATAVTNQTATIDITATVQEDISLDLDPDAGGATLTCGSVSGTVPNETGTFTPTAFNSSSGAVTLASCDILFRSNNAATTLRVESDRPSGNSLCEINPANACTGTDDSFAETNTGAGSATLAAGSFGAKLAAGYHACTGGWGTTNYRGLMPDTDATFGSTVCTQAANTDGTVQMDFFADPTVTQPANDYFLRALLTVSTA